ncbi:MAG: redox-regulated ATPase YchF, partial [Planctomycetes bacterium]|nr:redox-regulated ATPase YchF [Planctomycetota bacterium]
SEPPPPDHPPGMALTAGILGLPNVGKTTVFQAITGTEAGSRSNNMFSTTAPVPGVVQVPDPRLQRISDHIQTKRIIPAQMHVTDIPALVSGSSEGAGMGVGFLGAIKESDALLHVVRCFKNDGVQHTSGGIDPATDAEIVEMELTETDRATLKRNIERVAKKARTGDKETKAQLAAFEKALAALDGGTLLRQAEFTDPERELLYPLFLMTIKPVLFLANVGDDDQDGQSEHVAALRAYADKTGAEVAHLCGDLEAEFAVMSEADAAQFMADFGFAESGLSRIIHRTFDLLGLQTFFTAGEKETRAWTIHKGDTAPIGAGVIHTDFIKKFIRAEIYQFDDLMEHKSEKAIRDAGKMRLEGKEYVLQDGDVCHFLIAN